MNKLRLDYFLSLGSKLVDGDWLCSDHRAGVIIGEGISASCVNNARTSNRSISSFAQRKNKGVQPCGDNMPVIVMFNDGETTSGTVIEFCNWKLNGGYCGIASWTYDVEALIRMQDEHDEKQELYHVKGTDLNSKGVDKKESAPLVFTTEMKSINAKPEPDMLCRIEYAVDTGELFRVELVTFKFETDTQLLVVNSNGIALGIDKKNFIAWHPVEVTWQDEVAPYGITEDCGDVKFEHMLDRDEFINICHIVASMTDNKPEE